MTWGQTFFLAAPLWALHRAITILAIFYGARVGAGPELDFQKLNMYLSVGSGCVALLCFAFAIICAAIGR